MRIRTKKWARPELDACDYFVEDCKQYKGKWAEFFGNDKEIHLDLGCGKCTFMAELSNKNKDVNFIAVDISMDILGVARRNISEFWEDEKVSNVALTSYNIEKINDFISKEDKVTRIHINFCNPWQKSRCQKRRLTHPRQLECYKQILADDGELWFKTDNDDLYYATKNYLEESGFEIFLDTKDLNATDEPNIQSEHEVMFESQGIRTKALRAKMKK